MVEAPEKIWAERDPETNDKRWYSIKGTGHEYTRSDIAERQIAELRAGRVTLEERLATAYQAKYRCNEDANAERRVNRRLSEALEKIEDVDFDGYSLSELHEYVTDIARAALSGSGAGGWQTKAADDVLAERKRQVEAEGWTAEHDDSHKSGEMAIAAACYALNATDDADGPEIRFAGAELWPWADEWWKPGTDRRNLVKAGALILAEIERLDRLPAAPTAKGGR